MNKFKEQQIAQAIRNDYTEKQPTDLDTLRKLDAKVKRPANIFAYIFGGLGALIMGSGMSLIMTDIGSLLGISATMPVGIIIGVVGMIIAGVNYPIYKGILNGRKKKYGKEIFELSDEILSK